MFKTQIRANESGLEMKEKREVINVTQHYGNSKNTEAMFITSLGSNWNCACREIVSYGELLNTEWLERRTTFGNRKMWYLQGFDANDNPNYNCVIITYVHGTGYELDISAGIHGEDGKTVRYPLGTKLADVKKQALEIIKDAYINEKWYMVKRHPDLIDKHNSGKLCRNDCLVREEVREVISYDEYQSRIKVVF